MFEMLFNKDWSTLKKLIWLKASALGSGLVTLTGAIVSFISPKAQPVEALTIGIEPVQSGSGDPSPENVRPISGWTGANIYDEAQYDAQANPKLTISWQTEADTVYGGTLDVTGGVLTVTHAVVSLNDSAWDVGDGTAANIVSNDAGLVDRYGTGSRTIFGYCNYIKSGSGGALDNTVIRTNGNTTNKVQLVGYKTYFGVETAQEFLAIVSATPIQICYKLATPIEYTITSAELFTLLKGENNVWADTGDVTVTAYGTAVNQQSPFGLGMMNPMTLGSMNAEQDAEEPETEPEGVSE